MIMMRCCEEIVASGKETYASSNDWKPAQVFGKREGSWSTINK